MIRFILVAFIILLFSSASAQDPTEKRFQEEAAKAAEDTATVLGWIPKGVVSANLSQVAFKDWAQGGEDALAYTAFLLSGLTHRTQATQWSNQLKLAFGQSRIGGQGLRKTDDEIYFETLFIYKLKIAISPYASATLRTQFAPGYTYGTPTGDQQISAFFDPAYLTQSAGFAYQPITEFRTRLGVGAREVITSQFNHYADDPATMEIENTRVDGGFESVTDFLWPFAENMVFSSRLELFAPFKTLDRIIVRNDNTLTMKVNQYVNANVNVQLVNDVNVTPRTQIKESIAIGLSYTLL